MSVSGHMFGVLLSGTVITLVSPCESLSSGRSPAVGARHDSAMHRGGQRDFDFDIGGWTTRVWRLERSPSGSQTWSEYKGTRVVRELQDGRSNLGELALDAPVGHIGSLSLRLYNPVSHQWYVYSADSNYGTMSHPIVGEFRDGRGEFVGQEQYNGRTVLVRNILSFVIPDSCESEWTYSEDGGKTWETSWVETDTRIKDSAEVWD